MTLLWYVPIHVQPELPKKRWSVLPGSGSEPGRVQHENPCECRRSGESPGDPLRFTIKGGQSHDVTQAEALIADYKFEHVIADRAYDSDDFLTTIADSGAIAVIHPRSNRNASRSYDAHLYKERHLVECFIGKIKHYRRVFTRSDKLDTSYLGYLHFVGALIWLR